jgi:tetratricopeptide (TPR) repeat protein
LGAILWHVKRDYDGAIACFERALALDPRLVEAHTGLGLALQAKEKLDEAIDCHRKALALDPKNATPHINLGVAWREKGRLDKAIAHYHKALALNSRLAKAHYNLGLALSDLGRQDETIDCYERAIHLDPDLAEAHCNLGRALREKGRLAESLRAYRRGHELGSRQLNWEYPNSARWVRQAEWYVELEQKLPDVLAGQVQPADDRERLALAEVCRVQRRYAAAARLFAEALAGLPALAADVKAGRRYAAAFAAARAGCGEGDDAPPDGPERARLRLQALAWLRAELADYARLVETGKPEDRKWVRTGLQRWQHDPSLAAVRDAAALARLPGAERDGWRRLWADVAALLSGASAPW